MGTHQSNVQTVLFHFPRAPRTHTSRGRDVDREVRDGQEENAALSAFYYNSKFTLANVFLAQNMLSANIFMRKLL